MKTKVTGISIALFLVLFSIPAVFNATPRPEPDIGVKAYFSTDRVPRGHLVQAAIVLEIPAGYHVNSNRPMNKYAIPTNLKIEAPRGVVIGPVAYPRATVRRLKAVNNELLAVYE